MSDARVFLTPDEAVAMLADGDKVHTVRSSARGILLGADWGRKTLIERIRSAQCRELAGPIATGDGHGLVITDDTGSLFIETKGSE